MRPNIRDNLLLFVVLMILIFLSYWKAAAILWSIVDTNDFLNVSQNHIIKSFQGRSISDSIDSRINGLITPLIAAFSIIAYGIKTSYKTWLLTAILLFLLIATEASLAFLGSSQIEANAELSGIDLGILIAESVRNEQALISHLGLLLGIASLKLGETKENGV